MPSTEVISPIAAAFPDATVTVAADGISTLIVPLADLETSLLRVRGELGFSRFVDLTVVDRLQRQDRFELVYLFYSLGAKMWLRVKALTDGEVPSITPTVPGANWYEREAFDLFGIQFQGHPNLTRIMLPDSWQGFPLRRTEPLGSEPVDFTVTRRVYGADPPQADPPGVSHD
ncbi:MAG: NADH-quinone oxidoreductase subunit C [Chloroflexi bacterium]|nr:NADH-quinone oxidoreductase subunit C [Chloroflexota bacterium]MBV9598660.1 NADH-quinone oxidoreductase subunit C [Chloroflexota bacterium]